MTDGDSFKAVYLGKIITCRLLLIDAPELKQCYGSAARDSLASLINNKTGTLVILKEDRYHRLLVRLTIGNNDVQDYMIKKGLAWVYTVYTSDKQLKEIELNAQSTLAGLWANKRRIPPWQFRGLSKMARHAFATCD